VLLSDRLGDEEAEAEAARRRIAALKRIEDGREQVRGNDAEVVDADEDSIAGASVDLDVGAPVDAVMYGVRQ
jgi:hypothetical protein